MPRTTYSWRPRCFSSRFSLFIFSVVILLVFLPRGSVIVSLLLRTRCTANNARWRNASFWRSLAQQTIRRNLPYRYFRLPRSLLAFSFFSFYVSTFPHSGRRHPTTNSISAFWQFTRFLLFLQLLMLVFFVFFLFLFTHFVCYCQL